MTQTSAAEAGHSTPGTPPRDDLYRADFNADLAVRDDSENGTPVLTGHFARFNEWTEINSAFEGHFLERIAPGAFAKTIAESRDKMRVLFQHGKDILGQQVLGPIRDLREDNQGGYYEVPLFDGVPDLIVNGLRAGVYGSSFRFRSIRENFVRKPAKSDANPDGLPERTILEAQVREFGPVTFPAYAGATAGIRSLTDEFTIHRLAEDPERFSELIEALQSFYRHAGSEPSEATTPDPETVVHTAVNLDGKQVAEATIAHQRKEPEPSVVTTRARATKTGALYTTRKDQPKWRL